jgi:endonuclease YncB( thermonuclease family)
MKRLIAVVIVLAMAGVLLCGADAYAQRKGPSSSYRSYKGAKAIDGDTYRYKGERFRIQQYNAPERGQQGSRKATQQLQQKLDSGGYEWKPVAKDAYGRTIVRERKK